MSAEEDQLGAAGGIVDGLRALGLSPVLIGGMALVVLGSRRVTRDFDLVVAEPGERLARMVALFYDRGLELVSRLDAAGDVRSTISNRRVAAARLRLDAPSSASFYDPKGGLRIDLLFDFPLAAAALAENATAMRIRSHRFLVAAEADLLRLKRIARKERTAPGDLEDIAFLESRLRSPGGN